MKINLKRKFNIRRVEIIVSVVSLYIALFAISYNLGERYYVSRHPEPEKSVFNISQADKENYKDEIIIYDTMHRMANSKIEVEDKDKSGKLEINASQIQAVRIIVEKMNYPDKNYIFGVLDRWESGDFSSIADEHDYFWIRLSGEYIGASPASPKDSR